MSVLYKCPYCNVFFATKTDVKRHVFKVHGKKIGDVQPYNIWEEAKRRGRVAAIWKYRCLNSGKCELCGGTGELHTVGLPAGDPLKRCRRCLEALMWRCVDVKFLEAKPGESLRGVKVHVGAMDKY